MNWLKSLGISRAVAWLLHTNIRAAHIAMIAVGALAVNLLMLPIYIWWLWISRGRPG